MAVLGVCGGAVAQTADSAPTFRVSASELPAHVTVIAYGDQRFHDPANTTVADPVMRKLLVDRIAAEKPDAVQMSGDVPYKGTDPADYEQFRKETAPWRAAHLRVYPALGNHELSGGEKEGVAAWWAAFPELKGRRWYSVALGDRISLIQLDSDSDLTADSEQMHWLQMQLAALPPSVDFVMISLHHPPVADLQTHIEVDHNPRPNEIALRNFLSTVAPSFHAAIVVTAGHIHNYERTVVDGVTYLVSGGGGAHPYFVERTKDDQYQDVNFPVFHYIRFELGEKELTATMFKVQDPTAKEPVWQAKDHFVIAKK
jgi:3',5'-cyclic AMP phosphodiesterase CpdA